VITGGEALIGAAGTVLQWDGGAGRVLVNGEVWQAHSRQSMAPGARIKVVARDGLSLTVEPAHLPAA
jgi:membrane-bound serine protease (ClpP class)